MQGYLIHTINRFLSHLQKNRKIRPKAEIVKVNIGSALAVVPGWINVDASLNAFFAKWPRGVLKMLYKATGSNRWYSEVEYCRILQNHPFVHHNLRHGMPFHDEVADYLFSSHFLEHLTQEDGRNLIKEAYRVLKRGGMIRICVPDFEYSLSLYQSGKKEEAMSHIFTIFKPEALTRHHYMYDFDLLKQLLEAVGFVNIERCSYQQGKTPDIELLDNRPEETLYVEAIKI